MPDETILPGESLCVDLARKISREQIAFNTSADDDAQWCDGDVRRRTLLAQADCLGLRDVLVKLEVLCDRLRAHLDPEYSLPVTDYMLAESARSGVAQLIEGQDQGTAKPALGYAPGI
jgi:hypothetical protein